MVAPREDYCGGLLISTEALLENPSHLRCIPSLIKGALPFSTSSRPLASWNESGSFSSMRTAAKAAIPAALGLALLAR